MDAIKIYSLSDSYISYLRSDARLRNVFDNKSNARPNARRHARKYLGAVFSHRNFNYFIPFSSPKDSDYIALADGSKVIRKSIIPIIRMTTKDTASGAIELKRTLKLNNMIPVPASELTPYDISQETDTSYQQVIQKEWDFIRSHMTMIVKNAKVIYNQKTKCDTLFKGKKVPGYLAGTVDFQYAEEKCKAFQSRYPVSSKE